MASTQSNLHVEPLTQANEESLLSTAGAPGVLHITVAPPLQVLPGIGANCSVITSPVLSPVDDLKKEAPAGLSCSSEVQVLGTQSESIRL